MVWVESDYEDMEGISSELEKDFKIVGDLLESKVVELLKEEVLFYKNLNEDCNSG